jgi:hypothetical protein
MKHLEGSLEGRLAEILDGPNGPIVRDDEVIDAIAKIKAVFAEEGYVTKDLASRYADAKVTASKLMDVLPVKMTGSEWLARFTVECAKLGNKPIQAELVVKAAKRASS